MFTYQQNKSTECQPCPLETFKSLTQAPWVAKTIDEHRRLKACGSLAEAKAMKDKLPGCLYQAKEVLVSKGEKKYNKDKMGRWRLQSQCVLNGLVMCDFDHVDHPKEKFEEICRQHDLKALGIVLFFITPGGEGLKSVQIADINYNLVDNQQNTAKLFGLSIKIDKGCKDSSRLSYIPKWDDILYIDEERLFGYDNPLYDEKYGKQYREGNSQGTLDFGEDDAGKTDQDDELKVDLTAINMDQNEEGVYCYHGVPYTDILKKWLELMGGTPGIGDRHDRMLSLSGDLRRIVNNKPANVLWLMKQADFYKEFVKEGREGELERMAIDVCKFRPRGAMSDALAQTLDSFGIKYTKAEVQNNLPYDDWADRLMQIPLGCYEPALAHIDNPRVKPGGVITASGMYSVLLTRCDYQNWKGDMQRLNSLVLMCGEGCGQGTG